jgi:hypothetical protein
VPRDTPRAARLGILPYTQARPKCELKRYERRSSSMQFPLRSLLIAVAFIAISLVALLNANELWRVAVRGAVVLMVLIASAGAAWSIGETRAVCGGFVLFSLPFLTVFFGFKSSSDFLSRHLLESIHSRAFAATTEIIRGPFYPATYGGDVLTVDNQKDGTLFVTAIRPKQQDFVVVGHAVLAVPLGVIGGLIARAFYRRRLAAELAAQSSTRSALPTAH